VALAQARDAPRDQTPRIDMGARIYVGNLPFTANEQDVRALFESNGRGVREVKIIEDRDTGRPRGFAFVEMNTDAEADGAIQELNGVAFGGRTLTVNLARDREGGGGGGGGRGGGGGGYGGGGGGGGYGGGGGGRGGGGGGGGGRGGRGGDRGGGGGGRW
jgi:RNA recognition motif-containing protein